MYVTLCYIGSVTHTFLSHTYFSVIITMYSHSSTSHWSEKHRPSSISTPTTTHPTTHPHVILQINQITHIAIHPNTYTSKQTTQSTRHPFHQALIHPHTHQNTDQNKHIHHTHIQALNQLPIQHLTSADKQQGSQSHKHSPEQTTSPIHQAPTHSASISWLPGGCFQGST